LSGRVGIGVHGIGVECFFNDEEGSVGGFAVVF
jgi:hypothetical protein